MKVFHISRCHMILSGIGLVIVLAGVFFLGGCLQRGETSPACPTASSDAERITYLSTYGWTLEPAAIETLDLVLPADLTRNWADYAAMQNDQGLPFADFGGQTVRRYTYAVTNYPGIPTGVQANIYQCGEAIIGADIIVTGEGGGQYGIRQSDPQK